MCISKYPLIVMSVEDSLDYRVDVLEAMFPSLRPSQVVIGLLEQRAVNGNYKRNPFDFQNFNVSDVHLCVNGVHVVSSRLKLDFRNRGGNSVAYANLFDICSDIRKTDFDNDTTLYAFGIDMCQPGGDYANVLHTRNNHLTIQFRRPTVEPISCFAQASFLAFVEIDKMRIVTLIRS